MTAPRRAFFRHLFTTSFLGQSRPSCALVGLENPFLTECMSSGGTNPGRFQGIDPRGGAEFDENGPNLTEDIIFAIGTTLVGIKGPDEVQSSGIESTAGERSDIISSWRRAAVEHALAKANDGNAD